MLILGLGRSFRESPKYERQSIMLTGFGCGAFNRAISGIQEIHSWFRRTVGEGCLNDWAPDFFETYPAVHMGNRYFMDSRDVGSWPVVSFTDNVDPDGILSSVATGQYIHCEDNMVQYFRRTFVEYEGGSRHTSVYFS